MEWLLFTASGQVLNHRGCWGPTNFDGRNCQGTKGRSEPWVNSQLFHTSRPFLRLLLFLLGAFWGACLSKGSKFCCLWFRDSLSDQLCSTQPNKSRLGSNCSLVPSVPMDDVGCRFQWRDCNSPAQELFLILGFWYVYHLCMSCNWPDSLDDDTTSWPTCQGSFWKNLLDYNLSLDVSCSS